MIVGLSGYARSGKDTVARCMEGYTRRAFADPMRDMMLVLNPIVHDSVRLADAVQRIGWEGAKCQYPEARRLLQAFGTDVGRNMIDDDLWVQVSARDLRGWEKIVFTDVRFPNEADAIRKIGGQVWRIERPGYGPVNGHSSETALDGYEFDATVVNDGSVEDLFGKIETAFVTGRAF